MKRTLFGVVVALVTFTLTPAPAHAQFGKLGDAVKKKAKEAVAGKDDPKKTDGTPVAAAAPQVAISTDVLDRFMKGITAESGKRDAYVKRNACAQSSIQSPEYMNLMTAQGKELGARLVGKTEAEKNAIIQTMGQQMLVKQAEFVVTKCGPEVPEPGTAKFDNVGSDVSGFSVSQYAELKERITAYCQAVAKGSDTPEDSRIMFSAAETQAMRPRCTGLLSVLDKNT